VPSRNQGEKARISPGPKRAVTVHSIAALSEGRDFVGRFDVSGQHYEFTYSPVKAEIAGNKLVLVGKMTITGADGKPHSRPGIRAVLASTQGGIGSPPPTLGGWRQSAPVAIPPSGKVGDTRPAPAEGAAQTPPPATDNTGSSAFCGVMYFHLEGLEGPSLGVPADLSHTQLNARLFPTEDLGRKFHSAYSLLVATLSEGDAKTVGELIEILNQLMKEGSQAFASSPAGWSLVEMSPPDAAPGR
jgi:hypothetical protein